MSLCHHDDTSHIDIMTPLTSRVFSVFGFGPRRGKCEPAGPDPHMSVSCTKSLSVPCFAIPSCRLPPAICSVAASFTSSRSALLSFLSSLSPAVGPLLVFWDLLISSLSRSRSALVFLVIVNHPSSRCLPRTACLHFNAPRCSGASAAASCRHFSQHATLLVCCCPDWSSSLRDHLSASSSSCC